MRGVLLLCIGLIACEPTITDPCPGMRACPAGLCCPEGYSYLCDDHCYQQPCGPAQITCINVDRTDGCYGGGWEGTLTGSNSTGAAVRFDILEHVITVTAPAAGTGTIDCDTGVGSFTTNGTTYHGTWRHTETQGDRISNATFSGPGSASGTWDALRVE